jgi:methylmalonyl-CoA mutase cobalamin-binding subunit
VSALLAPAGITTVTVGTAPGGDAASSAAPVVVVCGSADATVDEVRAAVRRASALGAVTVVVAAGDPEAPVPGAAERITDDMDTLTFCDRMLDELGVPR